MTRSEAGKLGALKSNPKQKAEAKKRYYENPNYCRQCGQIIHPQEGVPQACSRAREKKFCNKTCAAKYNNLHRTRKPWSEETRQRVIKSLNKRFPNRSERPQRKKGQPTLDPSGKCERCGDTIQFRKINRKDRGDGWYLFRFYCDGCAPKARAAKLSTHPKVGNGVDQIADLTKGEMKEHYNRDAIRSYTTKTARQNYLKSGQPLTCRICGYSKAVDVCHKRPVSDFPDDTPVKDINHIDNLTCLCKNCHWELDHDLLDEGVVL